MRNFYVFILIAGIAGIFGSSGCNVINPAEVTPTYVHIDSFSFLHNAHNDSLGTSHKITNVYVYFNNSPVGIFDLPVTFPVIATQPGTLTVLPGIDFDGLTGYEVAYPMYLSDTMHLVPAPAAQLRFLPVTGYNEQAVLRIGETFEQGVTSGNSFTPRSGDIIVVNTAADVFDGLGSGLLNLPAGKDSATVLSKGGSITPGKDAYIELDYKGTATLTVGMRAKLNTGDVYEEYLIGLKPRADWGKIYIGIREFVAAHQGPEYNIILGAQKVAGSTEGNVYIDNVKVVTFFN